MAKDWDVAVGSAFYRKFGRLFLGKGDRVIRLESGTSLQGTMPYDETLLAQGLDPDHIQSYLLKVRLLPCDAYVEVPDPSRPSDDGWESVVVIPLSALGKRTEAKTITVPQGMKRTVSLPTRAVMNERNTLNLWQDNVSGEKICKGVLARVCKELDGYLTASIDESESALGFRKNPFEKGSERVRVITSIINWWLQSVYELHANYTEEQIRQLIKCDSKKSQTRNRSSISLSL